MKFSIRDIMLVTVIVALAVAWWVDRQAQARRIKELEEAAASQMAIHFIDLRRALPSSQAPAPNPPKP